MIKHLKKKISFFEGEAIISQLLKTLFEIALIWILIFIFAAKYSTNLHLIVFYMLSMMVSHSYIIRKCIDSQKRIYGHIIAILISAPLIFFALKILNPYFVLYKASFKLYFYFNILGVFSSLVLIFIYLIIKKIDAKTLRKYPKAMQSIKIFSTCAEGDILLIAYSIISLDYNMFNNSSLLLIYVYIFIFIILIILLLASIDHMDIIDKWASKKIF